MNSFIEPLEPRIAPAGDLIITDVVFRFTDATATVPGDVGFVSFTVKNIHPTETANPLGGRTGFHIHLSLDGTLSGNDPIIGKAENIAFSLSPGEPLRIVNEKVFLPALLLPSPTVKPGDYRILVEADSGRRVAESNEGNNIGASAALVHHVFEFGEVGGRSGVKLAATDAEGSAVVFSIAGKGTGRLVADGSVAIANNFLRLEITGTDGKSIISATGGGRGDDRVDIGTIAANVPLAAAKLGGVNLARDATFGALQALVLGGVGDFNLGIASVQQTLTIGGTNEPPPTVTLGRVADTDIVSARGLAKLQVIDWREFLGDDDTVSAPFITSLVVTGSKTGFDFVISGDFEAGLELPGMDKSGFSLGEAKITGTLRNSFFQIAGGSINDAIPGNVASITAGGGDNWTLDAEGKVGLLKIKGDLAGPGLAARQFGTVDVLGILDSNLTARDAGADGRAIKIIRAGLVDNIVVEAPLGGIESILVDEWRGGSIHALWIKNILTTGNPGENINGDFIVNLDLDGVDGNELVSGDFPKGITGNIGTVIAKRAVGGVWELASGVGSIIAKDSVVGWVIAGSDKGALTNGTIIKTIKITDSILGELTARAFGTLTTGGLLAGKFTALGESHGVAIKSINAGVAREHPILGDIVVSAKNGGIGAVNVGQWDNGLIETRYITKLTTRGVVNHPLIGTLPGNFSGDITLDFPNTVLGIGSMIIAGSAVNANIETHPEQSVGSLSADEWTGGSIQTGFIEHITIRGDAARGVAGNWTGNVSLENLEPALPLIFIQSAAIKGAVLNSVFTTTGVGSVKAFKMAAATNSTFNFPDASIGSFTIAGVPGSPGPFFSATNITAAQIGKLLVRDVNEAVSGVQYGIHTGSIASYFRFTGKTTTVALKNLDASQTADIAGDYRVEIT